jgi:hypothetical protein
MILTNTTLLHEFLINQDLELINLVQSGVSLMCSMIILFKLFDVGAFFSSVRLKRAKMKKERERKEYERMKKLFNSIQNHEELKLTSEEEEEGDAGIMKIARKKKTTPEQSV